MRTLLAIAFMAILAQTLTACVVYEEPYHYHHDHDWHDHDHWR